MEVILISPYEDLACLGVRSLSACLKRAGHRSRLVFLSHDRTAPYPDEALDDLVRLCRGSDLIGVTLTTNYFHNVAQITRKLKEALDTPVLWGGVHPTLRPEECIRHADMLCLGEGEETLLELVSRMERNVPLDDILGMWFRHGEEVLRNQTRPLIQNLDALPPMDHEYETHCLLVGNQIRPMSEDLVRRRFRTYSTTTSRGCPYRCAYCVNSFLKGLHDQRNPVRRRSIDHIMRELVGVKERFNGIIREVKFLDEDFLSRSRDDIEEFSERYRTETGIPFIVTTSPASISREKLTLLTQAGLRSLNMGIQTGARRTLGLFRRPNTNEQVERTHAVVHSFRRKMRMPWYHVITDNPWETEEDLAETLQLLSRLKPPFFLVIYSLTLFPETELYERARREGLLTDENEQVYRKNYFVCADNHANRLLHLLQTYSKNGLHIRPRLMSWLTSARLRRWGVSQTLYWVLSGVIQPFRPVFLVREAISDLADGDWHRIREHIEGSWAGRHLWARSGSRRTMALGYGKIG